MCNVAQLSPVRGGDHSDRRAIYLADQDGLGYQQSLLELDGKSSRVATGDIVSVAALTNTSSVITSLAPHANTTHQLQYGNGEKDTCIDFQGC